MAKFYSLLRSEKGKMLLRCSVLVGVFLHLTLKGCASGKVRHAVEKRWSNKEAQQKDVKAVGVAESQGAARPDSHPARLIHRGWGIATSSSIT